MKKSFTRQGRMWYVLGLLVSLFLVFIWKGGINGIKLGMDLAGGVRLTYLIDYTKYNEQYKNENELYAAKKNARDIITAQIDRRISELGVANYEARTELIDGKEYMVIELGGVSDITMAKSVIGKTVELEFGLQNTEKETDQTVAQRKLFADQILARLTEDKNMSFKQMGSLHGSKSVTYALYSGEKTALPTIYATSNILSSLQDGQIVKKPTYGTFIDMPEAFEKQGYTDQIGSVITRLISKKRTTRNTYNKLVFKAAVPDAKTKTTNTGAVTNVATYKNGAIVYPLGPVLSGLSGAKIAIYEVDAALSGMDYKTLSQHKTSKNIYTGWMEIAKLPQAIPGFVYDKNKEWTKVAYGSGQRLVHLMDTKNKDEKIFEQYEYTTDQESAKKIIDDLRSPEIYTIETLFVSKKQSRKSAIDPASGKILNGGFFEYAAAGTTQLGKPSVNITFNDIGKKIFCNITAANLKKQMAIFVDGKIKTNPVIQDKICGGQTQISGSFSKKEAQKLAKDLNEGALPAPLVLAQEEKVAPGLGLLALENILWAGLIGIVAITLYMAIMYGVRRASVSLIVLLMFLLFTMAAIKLLGAVLGLSGLAAIVLSIGMGVDATILIFERIIENQKAGQSQHDSIVNASKQARSAVRDGQASTGMIAILLFFMGVNIFKGFGTMMGLNIIIILFLIYPLIKILSLHIIVKDKK